MSALDQREAVRTLLHGRGDLIVIAGLGSAAYDLAAAGDEPLDFPLWGAMGGTVMVGLGLALAQPHRAVLVLTGDGDLLMGLGSLATIAAQRPSNLSIVVLDNERFGETGQQKTHTAMGADLAAIACACGIAHTATVHELQEVEQLRDRLRTKEGPLFAVVKVAVEEMPRVLPPRDGGFLTHRIREALLGRARALEG